MITLLAIDPGAVHCGLAVFENDSCVAAWEFAPERLFEAVGDLAAGQEVVVCEEFRVRNLPALIGNTLRTIEVIGTLRYICKMAGVPFVTQPASIKHVATAIARRSGISLTSRGAGPHARDAELHGIYRIHTQKGAT